MRLVGCRPCFLLAFFHMCIFIHPPTNPHKPTHPQTKKGGRSNRPGLERLDVLGHHCFMGSV